MADNNESLGDDLKDGAKNLANDAKEAANNAKESASEMASDTKEAANEFADDVKDTANDIADGAKEAANDIKESWNEATSNGENKKMIAGILAIVLGSLGVHKFILGYKKEGIILAAVTVLGYILMCVGIGFLVVMVTGIIGLIEGIIYLTKTDEEFMNTYQVGRKPWF